ncbi:monooxygenase FAD-binding [Fusarium beomiforme]|uniref:Monooxygenase FAD-binding n=1 Tax=Fusarium beomiforme TaxID=44412 RepID=A0A9P5DT39_9HYPO|nr:monooxygenase FAD-binding [Fusarium beomiforme]
MTPHANVSSLAAGTNGSIGDSMGKKQQNGISSSPTEFIETNQVINTDFLIAGCGPAGASLACFLGSYGFKGIMVSSAPGTANTPRAHITNMAAMECFRDIGLEREIEQVSMKGHDYMVHTRWCHSMAGQEYGRVFSWGNDPSRKGDYERASPTSPADLPQTLLEPVLIRRATNDGFTVRFNTTLVSLDKDSKTQQYIAMMRDELSKTDYQVRAKYVFGADGAQSRVVKEVNLPFIRKPGQGVAINILVKADLSHLIDSRKGNLHWIMQPDRENPNFSWMAIARMVKPWTEWMFILFPNRDWDPSLAPSSEEYRQQVQRLIGDDTPVEVLSISKWFINEVVAERYSEENIFCLGDAVHRHPPMNGLGSNTCVQDAYNLAWKLAYVEKGLADSSILDTYSHERQPVGTEVISRANQAFRDHFHAWDALGMLPTDVADRTRAVQELSQATPEGQDRRRALRKALETTAHEFHGLGVEMGQLYSSKAIYLADEPQPFIPGPRATENPVLYYDPSTYPGSRLPHVWLNKSIPTKPVSTIDLAGHGRFVLLTGIGGDAWKQAVDNICLEWEGLPLVAHSIGFRQDWEDFYFDWDRVRGVGESGAVLVRPDRFVAWRAQEVLESPEACAAKLRHVLRSILGYGKAKSTGVKL